MKDSKAKSLAGQIQKLMETEPDFPQRFKQRLVLESSKVANPIKFIVELFSKGVLCDGLDESGASFGLKETMVQLALLIVSSKGADAMEGLMQAFEESGNSELVSALRTWIVKDFDIQTDGHLSEGKGDGSAVQPVASEMTAKPQKKSYELSSSGTKLIDKLMSHEEKDLMEQLEAHLLGKVSKIVNSKQFWSSLVNLSVLHESDMELNPGRELEEGERTGKAIKAACSKKAIASLVLAFQSSGNECIIQETLQWLESSISKKKNYPISVKTLASQRSKEEPKGLKSTFFEQTSLSHGLSKLSTFKCQQISATQGISQVQFDKQKMMACAADGTLNLWYVRGSDEEPIKIAVNVKNITCFQFDDEILVLGTAQGSVHLFNAKTFEEKCSVRLFEPVVSLKFVESTLFIFFRIWDNMQLVVRMEISRPDMRLKNREDLINWRRHEDQIPGVCMYSDVSFVCFNNLVFVFDTKSGSRMIDDNKGQCFLSAPNIISTLSSGDLISTKRVVVAGCIYGTIGMWNTTSLARNQTPVKTWKGHTEAIVGLCHVSGQLLSLDKTGRLLLWSGCDLERLSVRPPPVPRVLAENFSNVSNFVDYERWFASASSEDGSINICTLPDSYLGAA